ncbi:MAG: hypothetical protein ACR2NX_06145 [Chthoniobacterales bacterium]
MKSTFGVSEQPFGESSRLLAYSAVVDGHKYLKTRNLGDFSTRELETDSQSSAPVVSDETILVCHYGAHKVTLYDSLLHVLSEVDLGKELIPFYAIFSSKEEFAYVFALRSANDKVSGKCVIRYAHEGTRLTNPRSLDVEAVGKLGEYGDSAFLLSDHGCQKLDFPDK